MANNAAMVLAKPAGKKPRDIAEALAARLAADPRITSAEVAGPGFLNLRLAPGEWQRVIRAARCLRGPISAARTWGSRKVNVEFVSGQPDRPDACRPYRGAVFGDALANLLAFAG